MENTDENTKVVENDHNQGKLQITKADKFDKTPLSGATFEIYANKDCTGNPAGTMTEDPDNKGTYISPFLNPGSYWIKETKAPDGYSQNTGQIFGGENGFTVTADSLTEGSDLLLNDHDNSLTILKYEKEGDTEPDKLITADSALFALYTDEINAKNAGLDKDNHPTGDPVRSGETSNGKLTWTGLANGTYYLRELDAPDGYILDTQVYTITLDNRKKDEDGHRIFAVEYKFIIRFWAVLN